MPERTLIRGGTVISMDDAVGDLRRGDVLIEDGRIVEVAAEIGAEDCEVIDADGMVVMPGLIDAHRHLWYSGVRGWAADSAWSEIVAGLWAKLATNYSAQDLYICNRVGILEMLDQGITTVFDWCHLINSDEHAQEAVRAHLELPHRAVFALGGSMSRKLAEFEGEQEAGDPWGAAREIRAGALASHDRLTMALAIQGPETTPMEVTEKDVAVARELGIPISMHIDVRGGAPASRGIAAMQENGLLGGDMQFVHCMGTSDEEFEMVAAVGGRASVTPICEVAAGWGVPPIVRMREAGLAPAVGADAVCTSSGDQFDEARLGLQTQRLASSLSEIEAGRPVDEYSQLGFSTREALETITINGAKACWLEDRVGSLTPGKAADVILLDGKGLHLAPLTDVVKSVVTAAHGGDVDTVLVDGRFVKRGGELLDVDLDAARAELAAMRDRVFGIESSADIRP